MISLPAAFYALAGYTQFIIWKPVQDSATGKTIKKPINWQTGWTHNPHDPKIWLDAETALQTAATVPDWGVGFVFTDNDPFWFLDLDSCYTADGWNANAQYMCRLFAGAAVEVSQSGAGLHIIGSGAVPHHGCDNAEHHMQFYTSGRFVALTGIGARGDAVYTPDPAIMAQFVAYFFPPKQASEISIDWVDEAVPEWQGPVDDVELIARMLASNTAASVFGHGVTIQALWDADDSVLGARYPDSNQGRGFDHSAADAALCAHLAFWTGKNPVRMDRIFRQSALYRDKWETREDYRIGTIGKAVAICKNVYHAGVPISDAPVNDWLDRQLKASRVITTPAPRPKTGYQFLSPDKQIEHFKGCVYVQHEHKIFTPLGILYKPESFKAMYGGFTFSMDYQNETTTKNAWECFTESQALEFPKVNATCFQPLVEPGAIIEEEGWLKVNTYVPIPTPRKRGDAAPFLSLIHKLFPVERDRQIITSYMAACVQYAGRKFTWTPLIQGCEGNGKSFLIETISHAIGFRYCHKPPARDISNVFNAWMRNKLFIGVEEIYIGDKRELMDALKTLITDDKIPITPKGVDQVMGDNLANFMATTNHKGAARIAAKKSRRWCQFYTPQQNEDDLSRDGMDGDYFPRLWNWARYQDGHAIINDWLRSYEIPDELNPATKCHRAPVTSSTAEAINDSLGGLEQEILEATEEGRTGFNGGWISSVALNRLLDNRRETKLFPPNRRREILSDLGYMPHPGLPKGRVNRVILPDNGKPILYIQVNHVHADLRGDAIIQEYSRAQGIDNTVNMNNT